MSEPKNYFAPGRVNLIGEHLDYNGGLVLPTAINLGVKLSYGKRNDEKIVFRSATHPFTTSINVSDELEYSAYQDWANYPIGIIHHLKKEGISLNGCELTYESNLPEGAGLSSSAAVEVVTAFALLGQSQSQINKVWLANFCKEVENIRRSGSSPRKARAAHPERRAGGPRHRAGRDIATPDRR